MCLQMHLTDNSGEPGIPEIPGNASGRTRKVDFEPNRRKCVKKCLLRTRFLNGNRNRDRQERENDSASDS